MKKIISMILIVCMLTIGATSAFAGRVEVENEDQYPGVYGSMWLQSHIAVNSYYADIESRITFPQQGYKSYTTSVEVYYVNSTGDYNLVYGEQQTGSLYGVYYGFETPWVDDYGDLSNNKWYAITSAYVDYYWYGEYSMTLEAETDLFY